VILEHNLLNNWGNATAKEDLSLEK